MTKSRPNHILVAGLGNLLLKDDGVGVHAVQALQNDLPDGVVAVEIGSSVLSALHMLEWADRILVLDAVRSTGAPGSVYLFGGHDPGVSRDQMSLHELSLLGAFRLISPKRRPEILVLGVELEEIGYGTELSPVVEQAMPKVLQVAQAIVEAWTNLPKRTARAKAMDLNKLLPSLALQEIETPHA